jgi:hypothetical protein
MRIHMRRRKEMVRPPPLVFSCILGSLPFWGAAFFWRKSMIVHNKQVVFETISTRSVLEAKLPAKLHANLPAILHANLPPP